MPQLDPTRLAALAILSCLAAVGCVRTDSDVYSAGEEGLAEFRNPIVETLYLEGCAPFIFQRSLRGEWVDQGPPFVCVWEGIAVAVEEDEVVETPFHAPSGTGFYRLRYPVGGRCKPGVPLSQADCQVQRDAFSPEFEVGRELCSEKEPDCRHRPAAPNQLCEDGVHFSGPSGECTRDPATGRCGYEFLECP